MEDYEQFRPSACGRLRPGAGPGRTESLAAPPGSAHVDEHHYAFQLSDEEFDTAFARIRHSGIIYYADPACRQPGPLYASANGRRGTYFRDPNGHLMEILTPLPAGPA